MEVPRAHFQLLWAYWVCSIFKTPIFNPKFSLQSISFSQITEISAPEHSPFQSFCRYKEHNFKNFTVHGRFTAASPSAKRSASAQGPLRGSNSRDYHIHAKKIISRSRALRFSIRRGTYLQKCGSSAPSPPVGGSLRASGGYAPHHLKCLAASDHSLNL